MRPARIGPYRSIDTSAPHYVYRCFDSDGRLLYIGCSNNPAKRIRQHANAPWFVDIAASTFEKFPDRRSAFAAERKTIYTERPLHNRKCNEQNDRDRVRAYVTDQIAGRLA